MPDNAPAPPVWCDDGGAPLAHYRCHKEVWAVQIAGGNYLSNADGSVTMPTADCGMVTLRPDTFKRYFPQPGDYLVVYDDGYKSISPRKAFEDGYTRIPE